MLQVEVVKNNVRAKDQQLELAQKQVHVWDEGIDILVITLLTLGNNFAHAVKTERIS